jgi:hypothetical protein
MFVSHFFHDNGRERCNGGGGGRRGGKRMRDIESERKIKMMRMDTTERDGGDKSLVNHAWAKSIYLY